MTATMQLPTRNRPTRHDLVVLLPAIAVPALGLFLGWRGGDLPAQIFRADMFRSSGLTVWNNLWFAGHPTFDYSLVMPVLGSVLDPRILAIVAGIVAAIAFAVVARRAWPQTHRWAVAWFSLSTATNFAVGRVTFALGLAFAICVVACIQTRRYAIAAALGAFTTITSPVAGLFVVIAATAWFVTTHSTPHRRGAAAIIACTLFPIGAVAIMFPSQSIFPYRGIDFARDIAVCAVAYFLIPKTQRQLRTATLLYTLTCCASFIVASPLGGNVSRLAQFFAGPIIAAVLVKHRTVLLRLAVIPLLLWQWIPAIDGATAGTTDPAAHAIFYQPLLDYLHAHPPQGRIEVPSLQRHWESVFVAEQHALARGWERQIDRAYNALFYEQALTADEYHAWLLDNAVEYVALADTQLDPASRTEQQLLSTPQPFLTPVLTTKHWHVWRVNDAHGYIDGPGRLVSMTTSKMIIDISGPASVTIHVHYTPRWSSTGTGCVTLAPMNWTRIQVATAGRYTIQPAWFPKECALEE